MNQFKVGDKVDVPDTRSGSRYVTEIVSATKIRVLDVVAPSPATIATWLRMAKHDSCPGMVVSIQGVKYWKD